MVASSLARTHNSSYFFHIDCLNSGTNHASHHGQFVAAYGVAAPPALNPELLGFAVSEVVALFILASTCVVWYAYYRIWMHRRAEHDSKDPKTWPIIGSQLEAVRNYDRLIDWITGFFRDDHHTVKMSFLSRCSYLTVEPANVEHILKTNFQNYPKGQESHYRLFDMLGNGILNTDGNMWKVHRKLGSLEFSIKKLKMLSSTVYKSNALKLVELLASSDQGVDVQELLLNMTFHSICEVAFGSDIMEASICQDPSIASALDNAQEMITRRYVFPWWRLQRFLNIGSEGVLRREIKRFNAFLDRIIQLKKSRMQEEFAKRYSGAAGSFKTTSDMDINVEGAAEDLLSRFILHAQKKASTAPGQKNTVNDEQANQTMLEEVRDAMMSFVMAGRDTTASTLCWFLYCMCINPDKQEEVFQELVHLEDRHYSRNDVNTERDYGKVGREHHITARAHDPHHMRGFAEKVLSYEALQSSSSPYLHAALAETLRLYPAVPRDGKVALSDDVLPDGTHLKAGDQVAYIPYAMGRMPFLWGDDALQFKPHRWLSNGTFQPQSPFKFTAFQAGPRMCLGKDAAYLQMKIVAAMLLRFFKFELASNHRVQYRMMMVMTMKHGLRVNITPR